MERFTISLDENLATEFDKLIRERGYQNRSEAVRDMLRGQLNTLHTKKYRSPFCVANLSYVYNHHERDLAERLTVIQHQHHDLVVASTHVHLDHDNCLETLMLRGSTQAVQKLSDALIAERGVRHGQLNLIPVEKDTLHRHTHSRPKI
jgi:CopG family nickel-responsive transcriptional regulator